jgi:NADH-quinone oxidoreductase subunit E
MATNFGLQSASGHLRVEEESKEAYAADVEQAFRADAQAIIDRYPYKRSALLPMLHLVQSYDGYVTGRGIALCAELLDLTTAEVSGVATFYTQYKRHPNGEFTVGVCTNTLCAVMGGDAIFKAVSEHLGIGHDETTADGKITLERVECNAACDYAPVVMTNWEFFDNQTPESVIALVDDIQAGKDVTPTRGPAKVVTFKEMSRVLAGFLDGRADEGVGAGPASLAGLKVAHANGWTAPSGQSAAAPAPSASATKATEPAAPKKATGPAAPKKAAPAAASAPATLFEAPATAVAADRGDFADGGFGEFSAKPAADGSGPAGWDIKGNANSMLFHTTTSPWYGRTKAEVWFRTEEAAKAAGFTDARERRAKRTTGEQA